MVGWTERRRSTQDDPKVIRREALAFLRKLRENVFVEAF